MGYNFIVSNGVRVKKAGDYPWPPSKPRDEEDKNRTIDLDTDDVLTKSPDGTYIVHTGLCCFGIVLRDDEVEPIEGDVKLRML